MTKSTLSLRKGNVKLDYPADSNNLLEVLEQHKIPIEYQCRSGYCGSCRVTLLKGEVDYLVSPLAFIQHNEILACCCYPCGDIEIDL